MVHVRGFEYTEISLDIIMSHWRREGMVAGWEGAETYIDAVKGRVIFRRLKLEEPIAAGYNIVPSEK